jgi:hypothetical protein
MDKFLSVFEKKDKKKGKTAAGSANASDSESRRSGSIDQSKYVTIPSYYLHTPSTSILDVRVEPDLVSTSVHSVLLDPVLNLLSLSRRFRRRSMGSQSIVEFQELIGFVMVPFKSARH